MFRLIRHKIGMWLIKSRSNNRLYLMIRALIIDLNLLFFNFDMREHTTHPGNENKDKIFYVLRGSGMTRGLLSEYVVALEKIMIAKKKGYIPVVDFCNYQIQYNEDKPIKGTFNSWEYYFEQPSDWSLTEVYRSKNVILSGWRFNERKINSLEISLEDINEHAAIQPYVYEIAEKKMVELFGENELDEEILGLFVRGTDYVKLKPIGHPIQPTLEQLCVKVDDFLNKHTNVKKILLTTEDSRIFDCLKNIYGDQIYSIDQELIDEYDEDEFVANSIPKFKYKFGLDYIVKIICLSKCDYLIAGNAMGSRFAKVINDRKYKECYLFDLGEYR